LLFHEKKRPQEASPEAATLAVAHSAPRHHLSLLTGNLSVNLLRRAKQLLHEAANKKPSATTTRALQKQIFGKAQQIERKDRDYLGEQDERYGGCHGMRRPGLAGW
jgi:hypothetical protein